MFIKKYKSFFITLWLFVLTVCSVAVATFAESENQNNDWGILGKAERPFLTQRSDELYAKGNTISIYKKDFDIIKQRYDLFPEDGDSSELAYKAVLREASLLQLAIKNGYTVTNQEVNDYVSLQKKSCADLEDENYTAFLNGLKMTNEQYWDSQYDVLKTELIISKYLAELRQEYRLTHNITTQTNEDNRTWREYVDSLAENYANSDHVKVLPQE